MNKIAILPLRAGSKGIPEKNKKKILGRPLFSWVLSEALFSNLDQVYVYTDDKWILQFVRREYSWSKKIMILEREENDARDNASTEAAMMNFVKKINDDFDILCLLQATSPLTTRYDINKTLTKIIDERYDSAHTVVNTKRFTWNENGESLNYNYKKRPRRQDFKGLYIENGAVYATTKKQFMDSGIRIGGKIALVEMPEDALIEIDELSDWLIVERLLENRIRKFKMNPEKIRYLVLDVDGVFTNGNITYNDNGEFSKTFSMRDGMGLELACENGLNIIIMTSEDSEIVRKRMEKLKIKYVYLGVKDKYSRLENIINKINIKRNQIAYVGDDTNDLSNICSVAWGIVPNDGIDIVKLKADLVLKRNGGNAIREAVSFILNYNKKF